MPQTRGASAKAPGYLQWITNTLLGRSEPDPDIDDWSNDVIEALAQRRLRCKWCPKRPKKKVCKHLRERDNLEKIYNEGVRRKRIPVLDREAIFKLYLGVTESGPEDSDDSTIKDQAGEDIPAVRRKSLILPKAQVSTTGRPSQPSPTKSAVGRKIAPPRPPLRAKLPLTSPVEALIRNTQQEETSSLEGSDLSDGYATGKEGDSEPLAASAPPPPPTTEAMVENLADTLDTGFEKLNKDFLYRMQQDGQENDQTSASIGSCRKLRNNTGKC